MKLTAPAAIAALSLASIASADMVTNTYDITWASGDTGEIFSDAIALPEVASIDAITLDISHTWSADLLITLTSPTGDVFDLMNNNGGNTDMGINAADGSLANVAPYTYLESGSGNGTFFGGAPLGGGTYDANAWASGGWAAGDWTLSVSDTVGGDGGSIGDVTIMYTIPAPGALALLGLAGLAGSRRRRA